MLQIHLGLIDFPYLHGIGLQDLGAAAEPVTVTGKMMKQKKGVPAYKSQLVFLEQIAQISQLFVIIVQI